MVDGVSALLADYEREFSARIASASDYMTAAFGPGKLPATSAAELDAADRELCEASEVLQSMYLEAAGQGSAMRDRVDICKANTARARDELRAARIKLGETRGAMDRASLLEGNSREQGEGDSHMDDLESGMEPDQRARLMNTTRRLHEGSESILESRRNIAQTESIGAGILQDLQNQRATIIRARENLGGVDEGLNQSSSIIGAMNRRAFVNKLVLYGVFMLFACFGLWMMVRKIVFQHGA